MFTFIGARNVMENHFIWFKGSFNERYINGLLLYGYIYIYIYIQLYICIACSITERRAQNKKIFQLERIVSHIFLFLFYLLSFLCLCIASIVLTMRRNGRYKRYVTYTSIYIIYVYMHERRVYGAAKENFGFKRYGNAASQQTIHL